MSSEFAPGIPRHEQISSWLREEIEQGAFAVDERLPSENALCERFDVSRVTVRRALQTLESEGLIYRRQGLGSFVRDRRVRPELVRLTDFAQDMERAGLRASSQVVWKGEVTCPDRASAWLEVEPGSPVYRIDRLRLGEGKAIGFDRTWFPLPYGRLVHRHDLRTDTFYRIFEEEYGIPIVSGRYRISAGAAEGDVASHLDVPEGEPLLRMERLSRTVAGRPVYFQQRCYRSDRVAYELELARDPEALEDATSSREGLPLRDFQVVFEEGD